MTASALPDTTTVPSAPDDAQRVAGRGAWAGWAAWTVAAAGLAMAWVGGPVGLAGAVLAALAALLALARGGRTAPDGAAGVPDPRSVPGVPRAGRVGAEVMVSEVVPVWSRQMAVTRDAANDGLAQILAAFTQMSDALLALTKNLETFSVAAAPGAVDGAVRQETPALAILTEASGRAFAQRDRAVAELARCAEGLTELQHLAKQARAIARHTRLVAFNASIEANRGQQQAEGGSQAVAIEVRMLATRMAETGAQIERKVADLSGAIQDARRAGEIDGTTPDELRLEIDVRARAALGALLAAVGASLQGSADVQKAASTLRDQLETVFVHFQFGDRISQMLSIVSDDMSRFARWVAANPRATQGDAADWLAALESSYTMEEQRSHHHGNVHVERDSGVEFF